MKKVSGLLSIIIILAFVVGAQAKFNLTATPPTIKAGSNLSPAEAALVTAILSPLNNSIGTNLNNLVTTANEDYATYGDIPDLTTGFANSGAYSAHAATQRGYQNYSLFALTVGGMLGLQLPSFKLDPAYVQDLKDDVKNIKEEGDLYAGFNVQPITVQVGITTGFLVKDLYLSLKFGTFQFEKGTDTGYFLWDTLNFGILANYSLFKERSLLLNMIVWRGISLGSGLIYQSSLIELGVGMSDMESGDITQTIGTTTVTGQVLLDPSMKFKIETSSIIIPLEVSTAIRLLWILNVSAGIGVDLCLGSSEISLSGIGTTDIGGDLANYLDVEGGNVEIVGGYKGDGPNFMRPKVMAGVGIGIGPVVIELPFTYYLNSGFNLGVQAGIVW